MTATGTSNATKPVTVTPRGVAHVGLSVIDLDRALRFYVDGLGLTVLPRPDFGLPGAWLQAGTAQVHLGVVDAIPEQRDPMGHFAFLVPAEQIPTMVARVEEFGGTVQMQPRTREDFGVPVTAAICCDTEGNRFELTDAG